MTDADVPVAGSDRELITIQQFLTLTGLKERKSAYQWMAKGWVEWVHMGGRRLIYADSIIKPGVSSGTSTQSNRHGERGRDEEGHQVPHRQPRPDHGHD